MKRRDFLIGTAGIVGAAGAAMAQAPAAPAPAAGQGRAGAGGRGGGGRGGGRGANIPAEKRARVSLMTLNYGSILKFPWTQNPDEAHYMSILDLPQYYQDTYGVSHMEFQHSHLVNTSGGQSQAAPDLAFFREMKAKLDAAQVTCSQVNIEIGTIPNLQGDARASWMAAGKRWVDAAPVLGCTRLMLNQTGLNQETKANTIAIWKELQDYAKPKGIKISAENRGAGGGGGRGRAGEAAAPAAPPAPPPDPRATATAAFTLLAEVIGAAGAYSNTDIGNVGAPDQQTLHAGIKALYPTSSGNMHIKSSPNWSIGKAVAYTESLGYKGLYSIEVNQDPAIRIVFNEIISNLA